METKEVIRTLAQTANDLDPATCKALLAVIDGEKKRSKLLSTKDASELLGVHVATIRLYGKNGLLTPIKFTARRIRWREDQLQDLMMKGASNGN